MARKSRATIVKEWEMAAAMAIAEVTKKLDTLTDAQKTISTAFGSAVILSFRWQPATIGGTWGQYRMENGSTNGFVAGNELYKMAELVGIEIPQFPRFK